MRIAIIGANGQLGVDLCSTLRAQGHIILPLTHKDIEVCDFAQVTAKLSGLAPEIVINTAAFHHLERCELDPTLAFAVNSVGPRHLALACRELDAALMHFSTDYVFGGGDSHPYSETDLPHPLNVYGASKLAGEAVVTLTWPKHYIVRTCGLYGLAGSSGKGGNFVENMLHKAKSCEILRVVDDQILTPTFTVDLAASVALLLETRQYGLYHVSASSQCFWYEVARTIFELEGCDAMLLPVKTHTINAPVVRPSYSVLNKGKLYSLGIQMPGWAEDLRRYLLARKKDS